ncbi:MAG: hypothetical protein PHR35_21660, partial [Kiritimatiellae bacterium]|nr:hypothetical protein [Kiritimatiellia bacterium]
LRRVCRRHPRRTRIRSRHGPESEQLRRGAHGGLGGRNTALPYGSSNAPVAGGSGGTGLFSWAPYVGGIGGGAVHIEARDRVTLDGRITAYGNWSYYANCGGGGGGSVYIRCRRFSGVNGSIEAAGGGSASSTGGAGGGGRIAVWRVHDDSVGIVAAAAGGTNAANPSYSGQAGSIVFDWLPPAGTTISVR